MSTSDNFFLTTPFTLEDLINNLRDMRGNMAPGPDGFLIVFYRRFWHMIGPQLLCLIEGFMQGSTIKRLNYGVLTLMLKIAGVENT